MTLDEQWPLTILNTTSETIPPFGCVRISGAAENARGTVIFSVAKPRGSEAGEPANTSDTYLFCGPQGVLPGSVGKATAGLPCAAAFSGSPNFANDWGPVVDSWTISAAGNGYRVVSAAIRGVVMVAPIDQLGGRGEVVRVYNDSQLTRKRGHITHILSPLNRDVSIIPEESDALFIRPVVFTYSLPIEKKPFAILLDDCEYESTVDATCVGVVAVEIDVTDASHERADCVESESEFLKSGTTGRVRILWREDQDKSGSAATGKQWALVLFDGGGGGGGGTSGGVTLTLAKMISTASKATWPGCTAPDEIEMQVGQAHVYVSDGDGKIKLAEQPEGLTSEQAAEWEKGNKPEVYNFDSLVDLKSGSLVVLSAARFAKGGGSGGGGSSSGGGGGAPAGGGGGGGSVGGDGEISIAEGETIYIATYARAVDYLAALESFGPKKMIATETGTCDDIKWRGEECS